MNAIKRSKKNRMIVVALASVFLSSLSLALSGCENALASSAAAIRAKTSSPVIVLSESSSNNVSSGGTVSFGDTAVGNTRDLVIKVDNSGMTDLVISGSGATLSIGSGIEAGSFSIVSQPSATIAPGASSTLTLRFSPLSLGEKSATVSLSTNDVSTPNFNFTIKGSCVLGTKDITAFGFASPAVTGLITDTVIGVNVPTGTNTALLVATFATTGVSVTANGIAQTSGVTVVDFSKGPVSYIVKAADATTKTYIVTVTVAATVPVLTTEAVGSIEWATASGGGSVSSDGGAAVVERGVCWSTSNDPATAIGKSKSGTYGTGAFAPCALSGLLPGTNYYVWAYAINSAGTGYGSSVSFTTKNPTLPTTATVTAINATSATSGCTAVADAGVTLQECGVCWSTAANPTTAENHVSGTSGASISISGLSLATTYYVRAYAILRSGEATKTIYANSDLSMKTVGYIGPSGGYVFYDAGVIIAGGARGDWRYLEAAPSDLGTYTWESGTPASASTNTGIGTGYQNTWDLCTAGGYAYPAAAYSFNATYGGYDDFFLPSKDELFLLMLNLANNSLGNISNGRYWSSSASGTSTAYYRINASSDGTYVNTANYLVRPIRRYQ